MEELVESFCLWMGFDGTHEELSNIKAAPLLEEMLSSSSSREIFLKQCDESCAIFFCGGDQVKISQVIFGVDGLKQHLTDLYDRGIPFAGTSAGCAIMSATMITGEGSFDVIKKGAVEVIEGLGLVKTAILDQHFIKRMRLNRLLSVLLDSKEVYGIGVDEGMAVAIVDDVHCEVLGAGVCVLIEKSPDDEAKGMTIKFLEGGDVFGI